MHNTKDNAFNNYDLIILMISLFLSNCGEHTVMKPGNYIFCRYFLFVCCVLFFNKESFFPNARMQFHGSLSQCKHACHFPLSLLILFLYKRDSFVLAQALEQLSSGPVQSADWKLILNTDSSTGKWWIGNEQQSRIARNMAVCIYVWKSCCETVWMRLS